MTRPARVTPQPGQEWSPATRKVLGPPGRNDLPAILPVIANHPTLLGPFLQWSAALALEGALEAADAELLALRAAFLCRSDFEWAQHVEYARSAGLEDETIAKAASDPAGADWEPRQRILLTAAGELVLKHEISDTTWAELEQHFDTAQLVEIPFVVGQYTMLSMVANGLGVPVGDEQAQLPEVP